MDNPADFWNEVIGNVIAGGNALIPKMDDIGREVPKPDESGLFHRSIGEQKGQIADYRRSLEHSESGVHIIEFSDHYSVHIDRYDPDRYPVKHLVHDSPRTLLQILGAGLFGALIFSLFRRR